MTLFYIKMCEQLRLNHLTNSAIDISAAGGVGESIVARIRCGQKKFRELLPSLPSKVFSLRMKSKIFQVCFLYCSDTWKTW